MRLLGELHVSSQTTYVISTDMAVSSADFTAFFQDEGKSIKGGENLHKSAHVESCSYSKGELVGSVVRGGKMFWRQLHNWCCRLYDYRFSQANTSTVWWQSDFLHRKNDHLNWWTSNRTQVKQDQKMSLLSPLITVPVFPYYGHMGSTGRGVTLVLCETPRGHTVTPSVFDSLDMRPVSLFTSSNPLK